jgi:hypothetical protein
LDKTHKLPGWIHVVCGTWMPKVHIADQTNITGFDIREIPEKNWKSVISLSFLSLLIATFPSNAV